MHYFFTQWDKIKTALRNKYIFLFLDYDGTLIPIVRRPCEAKVSPELKDVLSKLSVSNWCRLAIISGRSLEDIKRTIGLNNVIYSGNHGLEIEGPKIKFEAQVSAQSKTIIRQIYTNLQNRLAKIKGVLIEDKGLSISVHYRLVNKRDITRLKSIFHEATIVNLVSNKIGIKSGKKVLEIRPAVNWDKGKVVLWLLARLQVIFKNGSIFPVYIGDDVTDEDAFKALSRQGITVFVGRPKDSRARYYLKDPKEVLRFLRELLEYKRNKIWPN